MSDDLKIQVVYDMYDEDNESRYGSSIYNLKTKKFNTIQEFFDTEYYEGNGSNYALLTEDGTFVGVKTACHASMNALNLWVEGKPIKYYSLLRHHRSNKREDEQAWWDIILDPKSSPWRLVLNNVEIIKNKKGIPIAFSVDIDEKTNNQLLVNLSIAARFTFEHPGAFNTFSCLRKEGSLTNNQMVWASLLSRSGDTSQVCAGSTDPGHHPLTGYAEWDRFRSGSPKLDGFYTQKKDKYTPCNAIWYNSKTSSYPSLNPYQKNFNDYKKNLSNKELPPPKLKASFFAKLYDYYLTIEEQLKQQQLVSSTMSFKEYVNFIKETYKDE